MASAVGSHPDTALEYWNSNLRRESGRGHCQVGSLTGAVASKKVTEALKGSLSTDGNRASECKRKSEPNHEGLTGRAVTKGWS